LIEEFTENERLEQLTAEKRRLKILEYRQTVNAMLEERRQRRAEELQYLSQLHELELEEEKARYQDVPCAEWPLPNQKFKHTENIIVQQRIIILCIVSDI
jgi:arginine deiminase